MKSCCSKWMCRTSTTPRFPVSRYSLNAILQREGAMLSGPPSEVFTRPDRATDAGKDKKASDNHSSHFMSCTDSSEPTTLRFPVQHIPRQIVSFQTIIYLFFHFIDPQGVILNMSCKVIKQNIWKLVQFCEELLLSMNASHFNPFFLHL